jgi:hypothetical protein
MAGGEKLFFEVEENRDELAVVFFRYGGGYKDNAPLHIHLYAIPKTVPWRVDANDRPRP